MAVVRPFNTYGPRQSARAVIPTILAQLLVGRQRAAARHHDPDARLQLRRPTPSAGFIAVARLRPGDRRRSSTSGRARRSRSATSSQSSSTITGSSAPGRDRRAAASVPAAARSSGCCATTPGPASGRAGRRKCRWTRACAVPPTGCATTSTDGDRAATTSRFGAMDTLRTPDERFKDLPGYPFAPHYVEVDGICVCTTSTRDRATRRPC